MGSEERHNDEIRYDRRSERLHKHWILSYHILGDPKSASDASQIKNISREGICFITSQQYVPSTKLEMKLKTPYAPEPAVFIGVVQESREKQKGMLYETRLIFEDLSAEAKEIIDIIFESG